MEKIVKPWEEGEEEQVEDEAIAKQSRCFGSSLNPLLIIPPTSIR